MRICIIGIQNIKHMTLISMYTNYFDMHGIEYDLIYIDKFGIDEATTASKVYKYNTAKPFYNTKIGKIVKGLLFREYAKSIIRKNKYDFVVVWREQTASMFANFLSRYYPGRYCVNIRDLWDHRNFIITIGLTKAVNKSAFNTISSSGFLKSIPKADYLLVHSVNRDLLHDDMQNLIYETHKQPIVISYIGTVRFYDYCFKLIDAFSADSRFILKFIGQGSDEIKKYAEKHNIKNVQCIGRFEPHETMSLLKDANIINSAFGSKNTAEQSLMPIRYYYAIYTGCPVLTTEGTWVDSEAKRAGIGISVPSHMGTDSDVSDSVYRDYLQLKGKDIKGLIEKNKEEITKTNDSFIKRLGETLEAIEQ